MRAWLDDNPQDTFGKHEYKLAQFGLSPDAVKPLFERYMARYEVEPEGEQFVQSGNGPERWRKAVNFPIVHDHRQAVLVCQHRQIL